MVPEFIRANLWNGRICLCVSRSERAWNLQRLCAIMNNRFVILAALLLPLVAAPNARAQMMKSDPQPQVTVADLDAVAAESLADFEARAKKLDAAGQWLELQRVGHARRLQHPDEVAGWSAEATGAYSNGDIDTAIEAYKVRLSLKYDKADDGHLSTARAVRRKFPDLKLQPVEFVDSDTRLAQRPWGAKSFALLEQKNYDELERVAAELQKSNASDAKLFPFLQNFFDVLTWPDDYDFDKLQPAIEAWRRARPQSNFARLVEIDFWTNKAYSIRGGGYASSITPEMSARMDEALERGTRAIAELPDSANQSPLFFTVLQDWAKLSGAGRPFIDAVFEEGVAKFPDYQPIYLNHSILLLPRWFGAPGEWQAMATRSADAVGGIKGDMLFAMIMSRVTDSVLRLTWEPEPPLPYDFARFWRGLDALRAQHPDSVALRTIQIEVGDNQGFLPGSKGDFERMKSALREPNGHQVDWSFATYQVEQYRRAFGERRNTMLAAAKPVEQEKRD